MSNFYYKSKVAKNLVQISISNMDDVGYYQAMNEVSNQCKWRKRDIELWHRDFNNEMLRLTTVCPEYKNK